MSTAPPDPTPHGPEQQVAPTLPGGATALPRTVGWVPNPAEPTAFGRYQLVKLLGRGGMGSVYLAHDSQLDRQVAVKIPTIQGGAPELLERFYREAKAAATLHHPNLCPVYDVDEIDGVPYMTMAFIEGQPLSSLIKQGQPLTPQQATKIVRTIALALQEAHERGVVHRDLKPSNVMITPKGEPVVMDFGLALRALDTEEMRLTQTGMILGTLAYMSPEQVNGNRAIGPASDVYSLGVVLYELLTGKIPFEGAAGQMMARTAFEPPAPPSRHRPGLAPALDAVCLKALAKRPEERFASMADFAAALDRVWADADKPTALAPPRPLPRLPHRRGGTAGWLIGTGMLLLLLGLLTGGGRVMRWFGAHEAADRFEMGPLGVLARWWNARTAGEAPARLFPQAVGTCKRARQDTNASCPDVNIHAKGWRAVYEGGASPIEVFVYRVSPTEMEDMLGKARVKVLATGGSVRGDPHTGTIGYQLGTWHGRFYYDRGWLIHVRGRQDPVRFLEDYVRAFGKE